MSPYSRSMSDHEIFTDKSSGSRCTDKLIYRESEVGKLDPASSYEDGE